MYYTFEGIDGSFKSTICNHVCEKLKSLNVDVQLVSQPAGTEIANVLRDLTKKDFKNEKLTIFSETMLFLAARSQLFEYKIKTALQNNKLVISDRCNFSTIAYQTHKGFSADYIKQLIMNAPWFVKADLIFVVNIPYQIAERRIRERGEKIDHLEERLEHCEKIYREYDGEWLGKKIIHLEGLDQYGFEKTSKELADEALAIIIETIEKKKCEL